MLTRFEIYQRAQANCGLAVGDYVKITEKCANFFGGWDDRWIPEMDRTVGTIGRVGGIGSSGIYLDNGYTYPFFVLEQVEKPEEVPQKPADTFKPFDRVLARDRDNEIWRVDLYSHRENIRCDGKIVNSYITVGSYWKQCIPYEGNEHLLGTAKAPK